MLVSNRENRLEMPKIHFFGFHSSRLQRQNSPLNRDRDGQIPDIATTVIYLCAWSRYVEATLSDNIL